MAIINFSIILHSKIQNVYPLTRLQHLASKLVISIRLSKCMNFLPLPPFFCSTNQTNTTNQTNLKPLSLLLFALPSARSCKHNSIVDRSCKRPEKYKYSQHNAEEGECFMEWGFSFFLIVSHKIGERNAAGKPATVCPVVNAGEEKTKYE